MNGFSYLFKRIRDLRNYWKFKKKDWFASSKMVNRSRKVAEQEDEYQLFKASTFQKVDELLSSGHSKVIIKPNDVRHLHLFKRLVTDPSFTRYFDSRINDGKEIEITSFKLGD